MTIAPPPAPKRSWASRVLAIGLNVVIVTVGIFLSFLPISYHTLAEEFGVAYYLSILSIFVFASLSILLIWRNTIAVPLTIAASIAAMVLPGIPLPALIALVTVFKQRSWRTVIWLTLLVLTATITAGLWDVSLGSHSILATFSQSEPPPTTAELLSQFGWILPIGVIVWMWPFVTWGLIARTLTDRDRARSGEWRAEHVAQELRDAASTQAARQEVARELHDTIAAKLSTVSLHAGALEAQAAQNPELLDSARVVREAVQDSIEDLRYVVSQLRDPDPEASSRQHRYSLNDLDELIEEAHRSGERVRSRISLSDFSHCDPAIAHASYRIVQESLTNARKHAAGAPLSVTVQGSAANGIFIKVHTEALEFGAAASPSGPSRFEDPAQGSSARPAASPGHGLIGMRERAQQLGGTLNAQLAPEGGFHVDGWLPWISSEPRSGPSAA
ncbi:hypothetical protein G7067_01875 [Leucobacter insecticola]|uniref:histidine kinase n=1 Tax=Leucobacter insecticola TaxID=2714934 RepID=A0A6G8FGE4_9MICO|nr:histidine kinase [Leucobacter insecticola]QIM15438.1 hypothetical protein G7067_01875 [Leucobacter insecticola]